MSTFDNLLNITSIKIPNKEKDTVVTPAPMPTEHIFRFEGGLLATSPTAGACVSKDVCKTICRIVNDMRASDAKLTIDGAYEFILIRLDDYWGVVNREVMNAAYIYFDGDKLNACMVAHAINSQMRLTPEFVSLLKA